MTRIKIVTLAFMFISAPFILSWGTFGHEHINKSAVFGLPDSMQQFFYNHIDFITHESTVPDLRKYLISDKNESPRHFIDLENYGALDSMPLTYDAAKQKYGDKFLHQNGTLYWYLPEMMEKLTKAFREKKKTEILFLAGDLGHYVGDAHMPLHTSANYDGQETNQKGIHALWESVLPEMFGNNYHYYTGEATYIEDIGLRVRQIITESHSKVDTLLGADRELKKKLKEADIYNVDASGKIQKSKFGQPLFSKEYSVKFHTKLNGMVERQLIAAANATSSFWYTAWVNAGRPDLSGLDSKELTNRNISLLKQELEEWKKGKLFGMQSDKEF